MMESNCLYDFYGDGVTCLPVHDLDEEEQSRLCVAMHRAFGREAARIDCGPNEFERIRTILVPTLGDLCADLRTLSWCWEVAPEGDYHRCHYLCDQHTDRAIRKCLDAIDGDSCSIFDTEACTELECGFRGEEF